MDRPIGETLREMDAIDAQKEERARRRLERTTGLSAAVGFVALLLAFTERDGPPWRFIVAATVGAGAVGVAFLIQSSLTQWPRRDTRAPTIYATPDDHRTGTAK